MTNIQQYIKEKGVRLESFTPTYKEQLQLDKQGYIVRDWTNYYEYITLVDGHWELLKVGLQDDHNKLMDMIDSIS